MEEVHKTGRLKAIDMVEINPLIGDAGDVKKTIEAAILILKAGLGFSRRGLMTKGVTDIPLQTFPNNK